jgi:hypothetical protein
MNLAIVCSKCQRKLRVPEAARGRAVKCPNCNTVVRVPAAELNESDQVVETPVTPTKQAAARVKPTVNRDKPPVAVPARVQAASADEEEDSERPQRKGERFEGDEEPPMPPPKPRTSRPASLVLRIFVIILALISGAVSGAMGTWGFLQRQEDIQKIKSSPGNYFMFRDTFMSGEDALAAAKRERIGFILMMVNVGIAIVASVFVGMSRGWVGGVIMLAAVVGPAILVNVMTLIFTGLFIAAGLLSFLVFRRRPRKAATVEA